MRRVNFAILILGLFMVMAGSTNAQVTYSVNLGSQPVWGPVGYDAVQYYYMPDIESYYYVPQHRFYYYNNGRWSNSSSLPSRFSNYDLYKSYKIVVNEKNPWLKHKYYKEKYSSYKGRHDQKIIRDSRESKYYVNKNHPEHNNWIKQQKQINVKKQGNINKSGKNNKQTKQSNQKKQGNNKKQN